VSSEPTTNVMREVNDDAGDHRLTLNYVEVRPWRDKEGKAYNFHSLVWESRKGAQWTSAAVITAATFQEGSRRRRWVSDIHAFDAANGRAIIRVGEEGEPDAAGAVWVEYSWREWDMSRNADLRVIQLCEGPFEPYLVAGA
jgi:hypothetical protein